MNKIKAVVIDDEASNRRLIIKLVSRLNPNFEIMGEANNVISAYDLINKIKPELVFLDIKMPTGSGFDLLGMFDTINFEVVFISGFDSYALKAFEFNALDYVLKPINPVKFSKTLDKVQLKIRGKKIKPEELKDIIKSYDLKQLIISKISIHNGNQVIFLSIEDIIYIKSEEKCTCFKMKTDEKYTSSKELSDFTFILENHPYMVRLNKSTYININFVFSYSKGTICVITMKDGVTIEIPRRKKSEILELLTISKIKQT
jgi:two-component system LytT family response regulator